MKTITAREFFHTPALIKSLHPGQSILVTAKGKADFVVTKAGERRKKTLVDIEKETKEIFRKRRACVDTSALIRDLRG